MAEETVFELFDEYAARYARGEGPDARDYLARAGDAAPDLGRLIDAFLQAAPPREPSAESVDLLRARVRAEPPILQARVRRGLTREDVIEHLRVALGLEERTRKALGRRYHDLESGFLEPAGVDASVWNALTDILGANVRRLASWRPQPVVGEAALARYRRAPSPAALAAPDHDEYDEQVDSLFLSAR
jgi:hypothetical protein